MNYQLVLLLFTVLQLTLSTTSNAQRMVYIDDFVQAETHKQFKAKAAKGDFGKLGHNREVIQIDNQYIRRMNRDTRYSSGIFDLTEPLTIVLPNTGDRFQSMTVTNDQHYIKKTIYEPGAYTFTKADIGSRYVQVTIRIFVVANSQEDNAKVTALQDQILIKQQAPGKLELPEWDTIAQQQLRSHLLGLVKGIPDTKKVFGDEGAVDPIRHLIGTAAGYGGLSEEHAMYLNVYPAKNDGQTAYVLEVPKEVPVDAFWSISVYNKKGYFQKNDFDSYAYNNITAKKNADGSITIHLGGDTKQINYIPISPGWSYNIRMYRPQEALLDGSWTFPMCEELKKSAEK